MVGAPVRHAISTPEMCGLAGRLSSGRVTLADLQLAEKLIMALVNRLPPDSTIDIGIKDSQRLPPRRRRGGSPLSGVVLVMPGAGPSA